MKSDQHTSVGSASHKDSLPSVPVSSTVPRATLARKVDPRLCVDHCGSCLARMSESPAMVQGSGLGVQGGPGPNVHTVLTLQRCILITLSYAISSGSANCFMKYMRAFPGLACPL